MSKLLTVVLIGMLLVSVTIASFGSQPLETAAITQESVAVHKEKERKRSLGVIKGWGNPGPKLSDSKTLSKGDIEIERELGLSILKQYPEPFDLQTYLSDLACDADAIIIGSIKNATAYLTEDESFVFTSYDLRLKEILKDNSLAPLGRRGHITVARPGGVLTLDGRKIIAKDQAYLPLNIGKKYLIFLQYLPEKGIYTASISKGSFLIEKNRYKKLTEDQLPGVLEQGEDIAFLKNAIRKSVTGGCNSSLRGGAR